VRGQAWLLVVSNTSPISNLAVIDQLELLKARYGRILIPKAVSEELSRLGHFRGDASFAA